MAITTSQAVSTKVGTGWTMDVTDCGLDLNTSIKDFIVYFGGVLQDNANFTKNSAVQIQYNGSAIGSTIVTVQRKTPITARASNPSFKSTISLSDWNNEFNRIYNRLNEITNFGVGAQITNIIGQTFGGTTVFNGTTTFNDSLTFSSSANVVVHFLASWAFNSPPTLATKPDQITASGNEIPNCDWVRQSIRPAVNVGHSGGQVINHNTWTTVDLTNEFNDTDNAYTANVFTAPTSGVYLFDMRVGFGSACTSIDMNIIVNGGADFALEAFTVGADTISSRQKTTIVFMAANDVARFRVRQTNTGSATRTTNQGNIKIVKLGEIA